MMNDQEPTIVNGPRRVKIINKYSGPGGGAYFLAFIGAFVYFLQQATTFGEGVFGFFKAIIWPAELVYHLLKYLNV